MGYKKIQEKRKELNEKLEAKCAFIEAAQRLDSGLNEIDKTRQQVMQKNAWENKLAASCPKDVKSRE